MYLERVLGSKTKVNILSVLINSPGQGINEGQLAQLAEASASEVNRQINDLITIGLVNLTRVGRSKLYSINIDHFLYQSLCELFRSLTAIYHEIADKIRDYTVSIGPVETIILIGSLVTNSIRQDYVSNPSDIDIVIILDDDSNPDYLKKTLVEYTTNEIYTKYGINVYPIVLSKTDYISGLSNDKFIMNVHSYGETLFGKKPTRTSSMVDTKITRIS
jgi:predicted nucleotidyltransferase